MDKDYAWVPSSPGHRLDGILFSRQSDGTIKIEVCADKRATMQLSDRQKKRLIGLIESSMSKTKKQTSAEKSQKIHDKKKLRKELRRSKGNK